MSTKEDKSEPNGRKIQELIEDTHTEIANARRFLDHLGSDGHARRHIERILLELERRLADLHAWARRSTS